MSSWEPQRRTTTAELSRDGSTVLTHCRDDRVRLFDLATGLQRGVNLSVPGLVPLRHFAGGVDLTEPILLGHFEGGLVRVWDTRHLERQATAVSARKTNSERPTARTAVYRKAAISPLGGYVLFSTDSDPGYVRLADAVTGQPIGPPIPERNLQHLAFAPNDRMAAVASSHMRPTPYWQLYDTATGVRATPLPAMPNYSTGLAYSSDGRLLAVGRITGVTVLETATGAIPVTIPNEDFCSASAFHSDGLSLAVVSRKFGAAESLVRLWDLKTGQLIGEPRPLPGFVFSSHLSFIENGRTLLAFEPSGSGLHIYDARTCEPRRRNGPPGRVQNVEVRSHDGVVAVSYTSGVVLQWNLATGQAVGEPLRHPFPVVSMEYSTDGRFLAVTGEDHSVRLWDAATSLPLGPPRLHSAPVLAVRFNREGREVITATAAGEVRRWPVPGPLPDDPNQLETWLQAMTGYWASGGEAVLLAPEAWADRCADLKQQWPEADRNLSRYRAADSDLDAAWHDARARDAEQTGNAFALRWHLDRLATLRPKDWRVHALRGEVLAESGGTVESEAALAAARAMGSDRIVAEWLAHRAALRACPK